jgi:hypothetical protein
MLQSIKMEEVRNAYTVKLGYNNIGFCDTLSIASNIINTTILIIQRYSFITTLFLGPFDDVITKFYCILVTKPEEKMLIWRPRR